MHVAEQECAGSGDRIEWLLLADCSVEDCAQAKVTAGWYARRWELRYTTAS